MLKLTLLPDEYVTIGGDIVVHLTRVAGGRADVAVYADRSVPIVRGAVLERQGGQRPACLAPPPKTRARYYRDRIFPWNDDRERAVRAMKEIFQRLEESGSAGEAAALRRQLDRIIPPFWEEEAAAK